MNVTADIELIMSSSFFVFPFGRLLRSMDFMMNVCGSELSVHYLGIGGQNSLGYFSFQQKSNYVLMPIKHWDDVEN